MPDNAEIIPNANSPSLLVRLLEVVARGVRSSRGIQEALGVELRTVQYYRRAGEWLSLLEAGQYPRLTHLGLELVYDSERRSDAYQRAVWSVPLVRELLTETQGRLPTTQRIADAIRTTEPSLSAATVLRRASAVRGLIEPAIASPRAPSRTLEQLTLPLPTRLQALEPPRRLLTENHEYDPDLYRFLLTALLDQGELGLGQIRALLDSAGADSAPIGGYAALAVERGDAVRVEDHLVATEGACTRREATETTASIILSDPRYRSYIEALLQSETGGRAHEIRRDALGVRYRSWDRRLFGEPSTPENLDALLENVLMDRSLTAFPVAGTAGLDPRQQDGSFLDRWEDSGLGIALPPTTMHLQQGLAPINAQLRAMRQGMGRVCPPSLVYRPVRVHAGLMHPGESLPRSIPDLRSLRVRIVSNMPYATLLCALGLLHRLDSPNLQLRRRRGRWELRYRGRPAGELLDVLDDFARSRAWLPIRRRTGGVTTDDLIETLSSIGLMVCIGDLTTIDETFFTHLRTEAEEMEVAQRLAPLAEAIGSWLASAES